MKTSIYSPISRFFFDIFCKYYYILLNYNFFLNRVPTLLRNMYSFPLVIWFLVLVPVTTPYIQANIICIDVALQFVVILALSIFILNLVYV